VYTKRLLRQFVSHGGLAYAILGFFGGLLWLGFTTHTPGLVAPTFGDGPRPVAVPATGRVTLQESIDSVRRFAGQPSLILEGGIQADAEAGPRAELYYLESVSPTRGEDFFTVDARTGEVMEATLRARMAPVGETADVTFSAAEAVARRFAQTHFWGFDQLALVDRSTRTIESGAVYSFKWSQLASESGAELPVSVSLAVSGSGQVFWYLGQREPLQIQTIPAIEQARAVQIAQAWLQPKPISSSIHREEARCSHRRPRQVTRPHGHPDKPARSG